MPANSTLSTTVDERDGGADEGGAWLEPHQNAVTVKL
jgi:hypothetical protein